MPRPIEHRNGSTYPVDRVYAALTDQAFLRARLRRLGGKSSELSSFSIEGGTTLYTLRQTVDAEHLPSLARRVIRGDLVIERTESWTVVGGQYDGTVEGAVPGTPASVRGVTTLLDTEIGSEMVLTGTVKVSMPLVGGKLEELIVDQLVELLGAEGRFTQSWLESHDRAT